MNLKALSEHLGLSQTTVSRALNGYPEVSLKTRQRVGEAAQQMGYRPNHAARGLRPVKPAPSPLSCAQPPASQPTRIMASF